MTDTPALFWGTWQSGKLQPGQKHAAEEGPQAGGGVLGRRFQHASTSRSSWKWAVSFVSIEQAKRNATSEIANFDLEKTRAASVAAWNKALDVVELKGETAEQAQIFYTALYHTMLMPVDRTGENPLWTSSEPYYDDYYAIWDTFRTSGPLLTLIAPEHEKNSPVPSGYLPARWMASRCAKRQLQRAHARRQQRGILDHRRICERVERNRLGHCLCGRSE